MEKTTIKVDLAKLDKTRIDIRTYTNKEGIEVTVKEYAMDVVFLKEPKTIKQGDGWNLVKNSFVTNSPTKEERVNKIKMPVIGDGIGFVDTTSLQVKSADDFGNSPF